MEGPARVVFSDVDVYKRSAEELVERLVGWNL
jgi:hypothetical protein